MLKKDDIKKRKFTVVVNIISLNLLPIEDDKRFQLFRYIKKLVIFHIFIKLQYKFMHLRFKYVTLLTAALYISCP